MELFDYYRLSIKLLSEQLGTCTKASIYDAHVLKKAQKMIKEANKLSGKVKKSLEKYKGEEIPAEKELLELRGIIRRYQEVLGKKEDIPEDAKELSAYMQNLEEEFDETVKKGEQKQATIFMRDEKGKPILSTHMILGNLKENAKIITNNSAEGAPKIFKSKVSVQECLALDVKPVEPFFHPDKDVIRKKDGTVDLLERPIKFERMGHTETAIALSERLPEGTEYSCHLRVRRGSLVTEEVLKSLLKLGRSNGMGQWRGSGSKGQYCFKLVKSENPEKLPKGWE